MCKKALFTQTKIDGSAYFVCVCVYVRLYAVRLPGCSLPVENSFQISIFGKSHKIHEDIIYVYSLESLQCGE